MWVKICGNTSLEDARFAVEAGADAVGFVFAPSPRQVGTDLVRQITDKLPAVETYGVFVDAEFEEIVAAVTACGLTGVQLHRSADPLLASRLRQVSPRLVVLPVLHYKNCEDGLERQLTELRQNGGVDGVLVDSSTALAVGGTGTSFDWVGARDTFLRAAPHLRLIAAGGLSPENVKQAISTLRPWGVDVVSGVEKIPGKKDPARVMAFIQSAKEAVGEEADDDD